jgi:hypothetical protein
MMMVKYRIEIIHFISLATINFIVFNQYWLGLAIPPWDFIGGGMVEQYGFYNYGSFFDPPSWYPNAWFGIPQYQMLQDGGWFLPTLVVAEFLSWYPENAARLQAFIILLGSIGFYLLVRQFISQRLFALLGSVMFSFIPAFYSNAQHYGVVRSSALLPWLILFVSPRVIMSNYWAIPIGSFVLFQSIVGSYPGNLVSSIYTVAAFFLFFFAKEKKRFEYFVRVFILFISGTLMGMLRYLPSITDLTSFPQNIMNSSDLGGWNFSTFIYPYVRENLIGDPSMRSIFVGPLILSLFAFIKFRDKQIIFHCLLGVFSLILMMSGPVTEIIRNFLPFANISRFGMSDWRTTFNISIILVVLLTLSELKKTSRKRVFAAFAILSVELVVIWFIGGWMGFSNEDKISTLTILILTFLTVIVYLAAVNYSMNTLLISMSLTLIILTQVYAYTTYYGKNKLTWESREIDQNIYGQTFRSIEKKIDLPLKSRPKRILLTPPPFEQWQYRNDYRYNKFWVTGEFGALGYHNVKDNESYKALESRLQKESDPVIEFLLQSGATIPLDLKYIDDPNLENCSLVSPKCVISNEVVVTQVKFDRESEIFQISASKPFLLMQNEVYSPVWSGTICDVTECKEVRSIPILDSLRAWFMPEGSYLLTTKAETPFNFHRWVLFSVGLLIAISSNSVLRKLSRNN